MPDNKRLQFEDSVSNNLIIERLAEPKAYGRLVIKVLDSDRIELTQHRAAELLPILMEFVNTGELPSES